MNFSAPLHEEIPVKWYRCEVDRAVMRKLMERSDGRGLVQAVGHLALFFATMAAAYAVFLHITIANWFWTVPLLLVFTFCHGTVASFMGGVACHELCHKTMFRSQKLNEVLLHIFAFLSWFNPVTYRLSHVRHHQVTAHQGLDGEIILPQKLDWSELEPDEVALPQRLDGAFLRFLVLNFCPLPHPGAILSRFRLYVRYAKDDLDGLGLFAGGVWWMQTVLPADKPEARRRNARWARIIVIGHLLLAAILIATGHWFLALLFAGHGTYAGWLGNLTGLPQHLGMEPDVPDFRRCCRTYTCNSLVGFLYWNMQYHVEHHMFPAVPCYNLPALRAAIRDDVPPAPHGLLATWKEIIPRLREIDRERIAPAAT
ncbi:MAG: fatty acid desaturase [Candidatus Methylacidiphilales bacterium]|nr:fatty acid desaturase [Candidatus Methylacidiphilales bacterium]